MNDRFGIQVRGGCSCAGTYGHYLLNMNREMSHKITDKIKEGDFSKKPGWVRLSIHPTMTNMELYDILKAIEEVSIHANEWQEDYHYEKMSNEFYHNTKERDVKKEVLKLFEI